MPNEPRVDDQIPAEELAASFEAFLQDQEIDSADEDSLLRQQVAKDLTPHRKKQPKIPSNFDVGFYMSGFSNMKKIREYLKNYALDELKKM